MVVRLFCVASLLTMAGAAGASAIGVFFDNAGTRDAAEVAPFAMVTTFVVVRDLGGELSGYEFSVGATEGLSLIGATMLPDSGLNLGSAPTNWIVGVGQCLPERGPRAVMQLTVMLLADAVNLQLFLGASSPSSVFGEGPAYATCDDQIHAFEEITPAVINLRPESFGRVKHRYSGD